MSTTQIDLDVEHATVKLIDDRHTAFGTVQIANGGTTLNLGAARIGERTLLERLLDAYAEGGDDDIAEMHSALAARGFRPGG